jgi:hypothetical protein
MAHPLSKWVQAVLQAYVESSNGWAPTGRGHRHCAAARATRRRELHASTTLLAPLKISQHALVALDALAEKLGVGVGV